MRKLHSGPRKDDKQALGSWEAGTGLLCHMSEQRGEAAGRGYETKTKQKARCKALVLTAERQAVLQECQAKCPCPGPDSCLG